MFLHKQQNLPLSALYYCNDTKRQIKAARSTQGKSLHVN